MQLSTDDKVRKRFKMWTYLMKYFPDAFLAEVAVAVAGNDQHNLGQDLHWAREKSTDQLNTAFRHMWDHGRGTIKDIDGQYHLAKAIWRLKAELQLTIEREEAQKKEEEDARHKQLLKEQEELTLRYNSLAPYWTEKSTSDK